MYRVKSVWLRQSHCLPSVTITATNCQHPNIAKSPRPIRFENSKFLANKRRVRSRAYPSRREYEVKISKHRPGSQGCQGGNTWVWHFYAGFDTTRSLSFMLHQTRHGTWNESKISLSKINNMLKYKEFFLSSFSIPWRCQIMLWLGTRGRYDISYRGWLQYPPLEGLVWSLSWLLIGQMPGYSTLIGCWAPSAGGGAWWPLELCIVLVPLGIIIQHFRSLSKEELGDTGTSLVKNLLHYSHVGWRS